MAMLVDLDTLRPGMRAVVTDMDCSEALRRRMADFALVPGTQVLCRCRSPRGDVMALQLRRTVVALRSSDARHIRVRLC
ncbi:MAG: ferrous iron transport protein A [Oscillospiraceae bacterium]|nr:ferrous iron transport protein A [Oscillospiraceae bacterium]